MLDRLKNGGSLEPHKLLVEEVHSNNVAALGTDELKAVNKYREGLLRVLEKKKEKDQADDGDVKELTADRPALPEVGSLVQTRSSDKEEWSPVAVVVEVGDEKKDKKGYLKIVGTEGSNSHLSPHWAPMQLPLMRRAPSSLSTSLRPRRTRDSST